MVKRTRSAKKDQQKDGSTVDSTQRAMQSNPSLKAQIDRVSERYELLGHEKEWPEDEAQAVIALYDAALEAEFAGAREEYVAGLFAKAAEAGHVEAMSKAAVYAADLDEDGGYERWIIRAAQAGHVDSMHQLGAGLLNEGLIGKASVWLGKAAGAGDVGAIHDLGYLYMKTGRPDIAEHWLRIASRQGHVMAMVKLGALVYDRGEIKKARDLWLRAAEQGDAHAQTNLDMLRRQGRL